MIEAMKLFIKAVKSTWIFQLIFLIGFVNGIATVNAWSQSSTTNNNGGCIVTQAADAALRRELEMIRSTAVDPAQSFRGSNSCIADELLNSFDLSNAVPNLGALSPAMELVNSAINSAKQKVCQKINETINQQLSKITNVLNNFDSNLSSELQGVLANGWRDLRL